MSEQTAGPAGQPGAPVGTSAGTPPATSPRTSNGWLSRRVLIIILVVSGLLNLCFIAGAAWSRWHAPGRWASVEQRYHRMAAELDLSSEQRTGFDTYVAGMRVRTEKMQQQVAPLIGAAWEELAKPQADGAQVMRLFDEAAEKRREFQRETSAQTLKFLAILTPAQRGKFVAIARERRAPWLRSRSPTQ